VVDHLLGDRSHQAELTWHLPPGATVTAAGDGVWAADGETFRLWLAVVSDAATETAIVEGREPGDMSRQPQGPAPRCAPPPSRAPGGSGSVAPQGWVSPRFGVRVPAPVLCSRRSGPLPIA